MKTCYNVNILIKETIKKFFYPNNTKCCVCGKILLKEDNIYCIDCNDKLEWIKDNNRCEKCSKKIYEKGLCSNCKNENYSFKKGYSLWNYGKYSKKIISKIKNEKHKGLCISLGNILYEKTKHLDFLKEVDLILPVPIHTSKFKKRGFNQAYLIAKGFKDNTDKELRDDIIIKTLSTKEQKNLSKTKRKTNLWGAFKIKKENEIKNKKILIVDDVFTTGSTINLLSEILLSAGAKEVYFLTLATTESIN